MLSDYSKTEAAIKKFREKLETKLMEIKNAFDGNGAEEAVIDLADDIADDFNTFAHTMDIEPIFVMEEDEEDETEEFLESSEDTFYVSVGKTIYHTECALSLGYGPASMSPVRVKGVKCSKCE